MIGEAPKYKFNTNVFKTTATLDLSPEEIKKEETSVEDLGKFITDKAIPSLISDLKQLDGIPTDSDSLKDFFHKRGVNMRYLGKVSQLLSKISHFDKQKDVAITKEEAKQSKDIISL